MSVTLQVSHHNNPALQRLEAALRGDGATMAAGLAIANLAKVHLLKLNRQRPNKLGGKRTNFWAQAAHSIQPPRIEGENVAVVSIPHTGFAQRRYGGEITPKSAKRLAIPARPEYYAASPRRFPNLRYVRFGRAGAEALVERTTFATRLRKISSQPPAQTGNSQPPVAYWLRKQVRQKADETVLPSREEMQSAAATAISRYLAFQTR